MKRIKQINNLTIKQETAEQIGWFNQITVPNPNYNKFAVYSPDGICLEDGLTLEQAESYCNETLDYLKTERIFINLK